MAEEVWAYCVKEKQKRVMKDPKLEQMANGKYAYKGVCSSCGTKMQVFVGAEKAKQLLAQQAEQKAAGHVPGHETGEGKPAGEPAAEHLHEHEHSPQH